MRTQCKCVRACQSERGGQVLVVLFEVRMLRRQLLVDLVGVQDWLGLGIAEVVVVSHRGPR